MLRIQTSTALYHETPMPEMIQGLLEKFASLWWSSDTRLPDLGAVYTIREQLAREQRLERSLNALFKELQQSQGNEMEKQASQEKIEAICTGFVKDMFGLEERHIDAIRSYGILEEVAEFTRQARHFDPALSDQDIFQASRNVWSMNFMQLLLGLPVRLTPSIFAYSLLYPYSDNYLDDPALSMQNKIAFNQRFVRRLMGEDIVAADRREQRICDLIEMVETEFDRSRFPQVYESLLAIHRAQSKSLKLLRGDASPYEVDVLGICFEKGGTSVLADGYLVAGYLTEEQQDLMFHYGTLTQLMDDLEDAQQDLRSGLQTPFSQTARHWPLDTLTNRTLNYGLALLRRIDGIDMPGTEPLKEVLNRSIVPLMLTEAGSIGKHYSRSYVREIQSHSPYRFSFLNRQREKISRRVSAIGLVELLARSGYDGSGIGYE